MTTLSSETQTTPDYGRFAIGFDHRDRARLHALIDEVLDSNRWSEADMTARFERAWKAWNEVPAVATSSWSGGALAALHFAGVQGETVLCPSNTFMATPLAAIRAGAEVQFFDCNRDDLCMSFADFEQKAEQHEIFLVEDCAHAHGASWNGRKPGSYGDAGVYSMYATKTVSTGEGGVLVTRHPELVEFARAFRNY